LYSKTPLRKTKQREVILEVLNKMSSHPTADEVYDRVRKRLPNISLGTVYRNLDVLSEYGLIRKLDLAGTQKRFDGDTHEHYHFRCKKCGSVDDLPGQPIPHIDRLIEDMSDYLILSHRLEFTGYCPACRVEMEQSDGNAKVRQRGRVRGALESLVQAKSK
jgi:Fur family ferric uptake transcriptional regulator